MPNFPEQTGHPLGQGATTNTPKPPGRLHAALEPMGGICHDLGSAERRMCKVLDGLLGTEPEEATKEAQPEAPQEDTLETHIKQMAHNYFKAVESLQHQVDRLERL